jgi:hypothetical protein
MKKYLLLTAVASCLLTLSVSAQIEKGALFLGGAIAVSSEKMEIHNIPIDKAKAFAINPAVGIAIRTNLILGVDLMYGEMTEKYTTGSDRKTHLYGGGVFLRKYYTIGRNFYLFGQSELGYQATRFSYIESTSAYSQKAHQDIVRLNLTPGISYGITNRFFLELGLNDLLIIQYSNEESTNTNPPNVSQVSKRKAFGLRSSLDNSSVFTIGARFIIPKRKAATGS